MAARSWYWLGWSLGLTVALIILTANWHYLMEPIPVDVGRLAHLTGPRLHPGIPDTVALPETLLDGCHAADHLYELPSSSADPPQRQLHVDFPQFTAWAGWHIRQVVVLGWGAQQTTLLQLKLLNQDRLLKERQMRWQATDSFPPFYSTTVPAVPVDSMELGFVGAVPVRLNNIFLFVYLPRLVAWLGFCCIAILLPTALGVGSAFAWLGLGRLVAWRWPQTRTVPAYRWLLGLLVSAVLSLGALPALNPWADLWATGYLLLLAFAAGGEVWTLLRQQPTQPEFADRWLVSWVPLLTLFFVTATVVESELLRSNHVVPFDFERSLVIARYLSTGSALPASAGERPWLLSLLYAPWDLKTGDGSYSVYLGFLAGLNSLVAIAFEFYSRGWGLSWPRLLPWFALLPLLLQFHFYGQRPAMAGLALLAVWHWLQPGPHAHYWSGLALTLAIGLHPSALFLLPPAALYFLWTRPWHRGWWLAWQHLLIPTAAYLLWQQALQTAFPGTRNSLYFYPFMLSLDKPLPAALSFWEWLWTLPASHWYQLGWNRLGHFFNYWETGWWQITQPGAFRAVTLPNSFGWLAVPLLFYVLLTCRRYAFVWLTVVGPMLYHHFHIGQDHAQLHISALPFFALALILATEWDRHLWNPYYRWWFFLMICEWGLMNCQPLLVGLFNPQSRGVSGLKFYNCFGNDYFSYVVLAILPALIWAGLCWFTWPTATTTTVRPKT